MNKKKKILEAAPLEQAEKVPKDILKGLLKRVKDENDELDDHMGRIIGERERPVEFPYP